MILQFLYSRLPSKIVIFVIIIAFSATSALSETVVGGIISTDTTWGIAGSPYVASQSVMIAAGAMLTVEPGVEIRFQPNKGLSVVDGYLIVRGSLSNKIVFTAHASPPSASSNRWAYIGLGSNAVPATFDGEGNYTDGCIIEYAVVEYAGAGGIQGAIHAEGTAPLISHCIIQSNYAGGVYLSSANNVRVIGNNIHSNTYNGGNGGGICLISSHQAQITSNNVSSNSCGHGGGGICVVGSSGVVVHANTVSDNVDHLGGGGIIYGSSPAGTIRGNNVCRNSSGGGGGGVMLAGSSGTLLTENSISFNIADDDCGAGIGISDSPNTIVSANDIFNNTNITNPGGGLSVDYSSTGTIVTANIIRNNSSSDNEEGAGGGISGDTGTFVSNTISGNSSPRGAGVSCYSGTFVRNEIVSNIGRGVDCSGKAVFVENTISHNIGNGMYLSAAASLAGNSICSNSTIGIYLAAGSDRAIISSDPMNPTRLVNNSGTYQLYNNNTYQFSGDPSGPGNIDARNVYWGTTNSTDIANGIYDFFDNAGKGIVFFSPFTIPNTNNRPSITEVAITTNVLTLSFANSFEGALFDIERCLDLRTGTWETVCAIVVSNSETLHAWNHLTTNDAPSVFYRVKGSEWQLDW